MEKTLALKLNIIIGSTRPGRAGPKVAEWFRKFAEDHGKFEVALIDLNDFRLPVYDEPKHPRIQEYEKDHTKAWSESVASADAYVFVTPEYNYVAPSSLINALDYLVREWAYKPAGIVSYGGLSGGLRAAQSLKPLLTSLRIMPIPEGVAAPFFNKSMDEEGSFQSNDLIDQSAKVMLDELHRWAEALKVMRAA